MYLLDTNVVSELRRSRPHGAVVAWLQQIADADLFISAVTLAELQSGVELARENDPVKANQIEAWLASVEQTLHVLPMDAAAFRCWARLMHRRSDAMIAATAIVHDLTVVTRNVRDFESFGVRLLNPFLTR